MLWIYASAVRVVTVNRVSSLRGFYMCKPVQQIVENEKKMGALFTHSDKLHSKTYNG